MDHARRRVLASLDPLAAMATTDEAKLRERLAEVSVDSETLMAMLERLAPGEAREGLTDPDNVPEPPDEPVTRSGDLWLLGDHRLLCGDAGSEADLDRLSRARRVPLLATDRSTTTAGRRGSPTASSGHPTFATYGTSRR